MCGPSADVLWWWADVSGTNALDCGGRLTMVVWTGEHRRPRVKAIGSKTAARQGEVRRPAT